jgi:hypothetical protein
MPANPLPRRLPPREAIAEALRLEEPPGEPLGETDEAAGSLAELRALVAAIETRSDRLLARYCGRPVRPFAHLAADHRRRLPAPTHHASEWLP